MNVNQKLFPFIPTFLKKVYFGLKMAFNSESYLVTTGFMKSKITRSLNGIDDEELPWMPYPIIDFLSERISKSIDIFEYGSGSSTIFFAKRAKTITSIEYDNSWYEIIKHKLAEYKNSEIIFQEVSDSYIKKVSNHDPNMKYDLIIIDGRERVKCAIEAYKKLNKNGVLIFDDSHRDRYQKAFDFYVEKGFKRISFRGLKPSGMEIDETSIFYRSKNCLGI